MYNLRSVCVWKGCTHVISPGTVNFLSWVFFFEFFPNFFQKYKGSLELEVRAREADIEEGIVFEDMEIVSMLRLMLLFVVLVGDAIGYFRIFEDLRGHSGIVSMCHVVVAKIDNIGVAYPCNDRIYYWHIYILYSNGFIWFNKIINTGLLIFY